jgi:hypothetical protein
MFLKENDVIKLKKRGGKGMNKYPLIGKWLAVGIILLFIGTIINPSTAQETKNSRQGSTVTHPFALYPAEISMYIDSDDLALLNTPLMPEYGILVHFIIGYSALIPNWLLRPPFKILKNIFLYGTPFYSPQNITLTTQDVPSWASIYFTTPNVYIEISNTPHYSEVTLVLSVYQEAPAMAHSISLTATTAPLGRIAGAEYNTTLNFSVQWIPLLSIHVNNPNITTPPNTMTNASINVTNVGNGETLVNVIPPNIPGWTIESDPPWIDLPVDATEQVIIHITPLEDFQGSQQIEFLCVPHSINGDTGSPSSFKILAHYP